VPRDKIKRLPTCYFLNRETGSLDIYDGASGSSWAPAPPFESGGGGLVSTIDDHFAFSRMMLLFTQRMMDSPRPPKVFTDFWTLAYGAME
jgi:hypothetical protein